MSLRRSRQGGGDGGDEAGAAGRGRKSKLVVGDGDEVSHTVRAPLIAPWLLSEFIGWGLRMKDKSESARQLWVCRHLKKIVIIFAPQRVVHDCSQFSARGLLRFSNHPFLLTPLSTILYLSIKFRRWLKGRKDYLWETAWR